MTVLATSSNRFSTVVKYELAPEVRFCRDVLTVHDIAQTMVVGAVLGKYIDTPVATPTPTAGNTGTGSIGTVTVTSNANLQLGTYMLRIVAAAANAGSFVLDDPQGKTVGFGNVAVAFNQGGFSFTLADATDFIVGDSIAIVVSGTEKYKLVDATAVDGSQVAKAVYIADNAGNSGDVAIALNTDTTVLALTRGPVVVSDAGLSYAATVNTTPLKNALYAQLKAVGIIVETAN